MTSVRNGSKVQRGFQGRIHPGSGLWQRIVQHQQQLTVAFWAVLQPNTCHFNLTTLAPIRNLSSDHIVTWSIRRFSSFRRSFTSRLRICHVMKNHWVAIKNRRISASNVCFFSVIQQILVRSQIWQREVKELLKLLNLRIHHLMIWSELMYLITARVIRTVKWNRGPAPTGAKIRRFKSGSHC